MKFVLQIILIFIVSLGECIWRVEIVSLDRDSECGRTALRLNLQEDIIRVASLALPRRWFLRVFVPSEITEVSLVDGESRELDKDVSNPFTFPSTSNNNKCPSMSWVETGFNDGKLNDDFQFAVKTSQDSFNFRLRFTQAFPISSRMNIDSFDFCDSTAVIDVLNDDFDDVVCGADYDPPVGRLFRNDGQSLVLSPTTAAFEIFRCIALADYDGDGVIEFVAQDRRDKLSVWRVDSFAMSAPTIVRSLPRVNAESIVLQDIDGDGLIDCSTPGEGSVVIRRLCNFSRFLCSDNGKFWFRQKNDGTFEDVPRLPGLTQRDDTGGEEEGFYHADYNNDGLLDMFYVRNRKFNVYTARRAANSIEYDHQVDPPNVMPKMTTSGGKYELVDIRWTDCNLDGALDYYFSDSENIAACGLYVNNGDGTFKHVSSLNDAQCQSAEFVDINADGLIDLALVRQLRLFIGTGNCEFVEQSTREPGFLNNLAKTVFAVDFDRDGDMDLASPPYIWLNQLIEQGGYAARDILPSTPIDVTAVGDAKMKTPIGAQITIYNGDTLEMIGRQDVLSQSGRHAASLTRKRLYSNALQTSVRVLFPSGSVTWLLGVTTARTTRSEPIVEVTVTEKIGGGVKAEFHFERPQLNTAVTTIVVGAEQRSLEAGFDATFDWRGSSGGSLSAVVSVDNDDIELHKLYAVSVPAATSIDLRQSVGANGNLTSLLRRFLIRNPNQVEATLTLTLSEVDLRVPPEVADIASVESRAITVELLIQPNATATTNQMTSTTMTNSNGEIVTLPPMASTPSSSTNDNTNNVTNDITSSQTSIDVVDSSQTPTSSPLLYALIAAAAVCCLVFVLVVVVFRRRQQRKQNVAVEQIDNSSPDIIYSSAKDLDAGIYGAAPILSDYDTIFAADQVAYNESSFRNIK